MVSTPAAALSCTAECRSRTVLSSAAISTSKAITPRSGRTGSDGDDLATLAGLFQAVYRQVQTHAQADPDADADLLQGTVKQIEDEAAKGATASPDKIRKWLHTLGRLAPDVLEVVVNALTNPGAAVASGIRLVARACSGKADNRATR